MYRLLELRTLRNELLIECIISLEDSTIREPIRNSPFCGE